MNSEDIIRKNKEKRKNLYNEAKTQELPKNLKYVKGLISRTLITIIFVLGSIIYVSINTKNKELYKKYVLDNTLEFTKINNLYQSIFGKVDFLNNKKATPVFNNISYTNIEEYKNGVKLNVNPSEPVTAISSGIVVFLGNKDDLGNTVIIQGNDGVDIWYSNITDTNLLLYDYVEKGSILGTANSDTVVITLLKDDKYLNYEEYLKSL